MTGNAAILVLIGVAVLTIASVEVGKAETAIVPAAATETPIARPIIIDEISQRIILGYYQHQFNEWSQRHGVAEVKRSGKNPPLGLATRGEIPPGLTTLLVVNERLPPGLKLRELPPELLRQLPPLRADRRYLIADDRVMLVQRTTNIILDTLFVAAIDLVE